MKERLYAVFAFAIYATLITLAVGGCGQQVSPGSNNELPVNPSDSSFIQFENKSSFPVHLYSSSYSRDYDENPFASVDMNRTSAAIAYPAGAAEFYITYLLSVDGFAIPYAPPGEAGYVSGWVAANQATAIPIPPLSDRLSGQQMASSVTNKVYVKIQNASYSALEFFQGSSPLNTREDAQKTVNARETKTYLIQIGPAASYSFKRNGITTLNFPAGMTQFEAGHVYSFLYDGTILKLLSDRALSINSALVDVLPPLAVPQGLNISLVSESSIKLEWDAVSGATGYKVYKSTADSGGEYIELASTAGTTWTDTGLIAGTCYYYKVLAVDGLRNSDFSMVVAGISSLS
jgi:hypothetical protein